jgi:hypothetical protein
MGIEYARILSRGLFPVTICDQSGSADSELTDWALLSVIQEKWGVHVHQVLQNLKYSQGYNVFPNTLSYWS